MTPQQFAKQILIRARVITLRREAEAAARAYLDAEQRAKDRAVIDRHADDPLPPEHVRLRQMLLGIARGDRDAQSRKLLPPPRKGE